MPGKTARRPRARACTSAKGSRGPERPSPSHVEGSTSARIRVPVATIPPGRRGPVHVRQGAGMTDLAIYGAAFARAVAAAGPNAPAVLCHDDADGLSAGAILARAFARTGHRPAHVRIIGRGESAWSPLVRDELARLAPGCLVVTDLGVQAGTILPGIPTVLVDHHVPRGMPSASEAVVISGHGDVPLRHQACSPMRARRPCAIPATWPGSPGSGSSGTSANAGRTPTSPKSWTRFERSTRPRRCARW